MPVHHSGGGFGRRHRCSSPSQSSATYAYCHEANPAAGSFASGIVGDRTPGGGVIVPGVSSSVPGFIVAVVLFAVTQAILSLSILKLPHRYASLLLGGTGLALTIVALILASVLTHGLTIDGMASWLATTVVVWLVTTIGAITLPELLIRDGAGST